MLGVWGKAFYLVRGIRTLQHTAKDLAALVQESIVLENCQQYSLVDVPTLIL